MEQELLSYDFLFIGGINHIYTFKTYVNAAYEVKFKPSSYLVDDPSFEDFVFEMVIVLTTNPYGLKLPPVDSLVSATIARIVFHFFNAHERVVIYVCDDSDSKASVRQKLFNRWYERYKKDIFIKMDIALAIDERGIVYSAELVSRLDNPYFIAICESFKRAISGQKE